MDVDVTVQDVGIFGEGPFGRDFDLLKTGVEAHATSQDHEHEGKRQAVSTCGPEGFGSGTRRLIVLETEGLLAEDCIGQLFELDRVSCPFADVFLEKRPHFVAQRHDLFIADDERRIRDQAERCAREQLFRRDVPTVGLRERG